MTGTSRLKGWQRCRRKAVMHTPEKKKQIIETQIKTEIQGQIQSMKMEEQGGVYAAVAPKHD
jgi:hypothetical protein